MSMGKDKPVAKTGEEHDVITGWRHMLAYMSKPGVTKKIKKAMRRRSRRDGKNTLKKEIRDD